MLDSYRYFTLDTIGVFLAGFIVSFVVAYFVVLAFMKLIQKIRLTHFAIYRFVLAAVLAVYHALSRSRHKEEIRLLRIVIH